MGSTSWMMRTSLVAALIAATGALHADVPLAPEFAEQWRFLPGIALPGAGGIATADVDGDGAADFLIAGRNYFSGSSALLVIGAADTQAGVKQAIVIPGGSTVQVAKVLATTIDDALHVLVVDTDGTVRDYSGWPLSEHQNYAISAGVMAAAVGDLSGDGQVELLVATADAIDAFDAVSGGPLWTSAISGIHALALAQLDADPALEIVTSTGAVIDAATRAIDWQYPDGFGNSIAAGHLLGNSSNQFVGGYSNYFITFRSTPWSPLWSAGKPYQIDHVLTADLDGNDRDVIITAARQGGGVDAWDSTTHQIRFSAPGFSWDVSALGVAALFPGQSKQLLIAGREWSGERTLRLLDTSTGSIPWSYTPWHGIFSPVAIADVDGDGKDEVVVAGSDPNGNAGAIAVFDADTGILEWQAADPGGYGNNAFFVSTAKILLAPHNTDAAMDVVLAGNSNYDGRITVFDGATHAVRLKIGEYATGPLGSRPITDAQLVDFDGNGVLDYVVSSPSISSNVSGALVQVFSGVDGQPLWSSDPIGTGFFPINNVLVTGPVSSATSEVIAVMPWYLQAFDLQTRSPTWALFVQSDAAAYVPNGIHGAEFLTFRNTGTVTFYDAETHTELRSFALDPPLLAVVAPAGDSRRLLAASNGALVLIDGLTGSQLAASTELGAQLGVHDQLAAKPSGSGFWSVASGTDLGIFKHQVALGETIFQSGFEVVQQMPEVRR